MHLGDSEPSAIAEVRPVIQGYRFANTWHGNERAGSTGCVLFSLKLDQAWNSHRPLLV
jgi:hypothetical protein